ncbi:alpha/beta fold hydrolase, partial [Oleiphilus sp. HI0125]
MAHYFSSDNVKLHYRDIGNGPTIIFLHGFGMHSGHWLPYAYPLSRKYRVIIPDLRGFGRSHHAHFK